MRTSTASSTSTSKLPRRIRRRVARIGITLGAALLIGAGLGATPASAQDLGGLDLNAACQNQYNSYYWAKAIQYNVYGWACVAPWDSGRPPINVWQECRREYGATYDGAPVYATYNPYSWYCTTG
ncbi:hypothetical protein [Streptantibioticus ferralitis]|uniref:Lectin-like protein BA14k n=1 Tax=Streptantibioticus ferralitis TaxID=236510 RepID=A0ABT5ZC93_9ACTN|nr:hypothetical protein [Streptantibioticus ferralitis]MDF2261458.1 hypothetical protein [Streptantibioticus ferralitis]